MANTSIRRTNSSNGNRKKWTFSAWIKRTGLGSVQRLLSCDEAGNNNHDDFYQFQNDDSLVLGHYDSGYYANLSTNRKFRDTNGWYHFVITWDTAQSTASDRFKFYVNGVQETSFSTSTYPSQNADSFINTTEPMEIGKRSDNDTQYLDAMLTHVHFCDGYAYAPSDFGETDSTTGIWKIKTSPSVSYGTNGFFILKDSNSLTDQSSNSNNWTSVSGNLTSLKDCPDNVFATINPLNNRFAGGTFSIGNTKIEPSSSAHGAWNTGTLGVSSGKYYWEVKVSGSNNGDECQVGIADKSPTGNSQSSTAGHSFGYNSNGEYGIYAWNGAFIGSAVANPYTSYGSSCSNGIIMIAIDLDNNKFYGGLNGAWFDSGNPANGTNGKTIQAVASTQDKFYYPAISTYQGYTGTVEFNFGNGYFGTTAVSSAQNPDDGIGIFEYDPPTGYRALCTKSINAQEYS